MPASPGQVITVRLVGQFDVVTGAWPTRSASCEGVDRLPLDLELAVVRLQAGDDVRACTSIDVALLTDLGLAGGEVPVTTAGWIEHGVSPLVARATVDGCSGGWELRVVALEPGSDRLTEPASPPEQPPFAVLRFWEPVSTTGACAMRRRCVDSWGADITVRAAPDAGGDG